MFEWNKDTFIAESPIIYIKNEIIGDYVLPITRAILIVSIYVLAFVYLPIKFLEALGA